MRHLLAAALRLSRAWPATVVALVALQGLVYFILQIRLHIPHWRPLSVAAALPLILYMLAVADTAASWTRQRHSVELRPLLRWSFKRLAASLRCLTLQAVSLGGVTLLIAGTVYAAAYFANFALLRRLPTLWRGLPNLWRTLPRINWHVPPPLEAWTSAILQTDRPTLALAIAVGAWVCTCILFIVRWSLALDIAVMEKVRAGTAMRISWNRTRGHVKRLAWVNIAFVVAFVLLRIGCARLGHELHIETHLPYMGALLVGPLWALARGVLYAEVSRSALSPSRKQFQAAETFPGRY